MKTAGEKQKLTKLFTLALAIVTISVFNACVQNAANSVANQQTTNQQKPEPVNENKAAPTPTAEKLEPPKVYLSICAECHGDKGEGVDDHPQLKGVTTREEDPLSDEKLLAIINDAKSQGLSDEMPSFKKKLSEAEKQEIIRWLKTLK